MVIISHTVCLAQYVPKSMAQPAVDLSDGAVSAIDHISHSQSLVVYMYIHYSHAKLIACVQARHGASRSSQAQTIRTQPVSTPVPPHHAQLVEAFLAARRPSTDIPFLAA